jgi:hypothetical protein
MSLLERLSNNGLPVFVSLVGLAVTIVMVSASLQRRTKAQRLSALGGRALVYPSKLPFGN